MNEGTQLPAEKEYRFDRVPPEQVVAAAIWEYCREWMQQPNTSRKEAVKRGRRATLGKLFGTEGFPSTAWLNLSQTRQKECAERWRIAPEELEACGVWDLIKGFCTDGPQSETTWKRRLRKTGRVIFDLGVAPRDVRISQIRAVVVATAERMKLQAAVRGKNQAAIEKALLAPVKKEKLAALENKQMAAMPQQPQPTRAALHTRFQAWLDAHQEWWEGRGTRGRPAARDAMMPIREEPNRMERWEQALRELGCVVYNVGPVASEISTKAPRRKPTRAELLNSFEAWLDANPAWWNGRGTRGRRGITVGKRTFNDGLRYLAWLRITRAFDKGTRTRSPDLAACEFTGKQPTEFKIWLSLPADQRVRRRWAHQEVTRWLKFVTALGAGVSELD